jgi:hypothetical protein
MPTVAPTLEVYRHASDNPAFDCGRACAQSIISSLTQGVAVGVAATAAQKAQPVPVIQDGLRQREAYPNDVPNNWFTHPDELVDLLNGDPMLQSFGFTDWRVAAYDTLDEMLEHIGLTLQRGVPAIANLRTEDHWVTVSRATYDNGVVAGLFMLDPLNKRNSPGAAGHTYVDGCATDGEVIWEYHDLTKGQLGSYSLQVGTFPPANYAGKYVAIVYGGGPRDVADMLALRNRVKKLHRRPKGPTPPLRIREELRRVAGVIEYGAFTRLAASDAALTIRYVHDIEARLTGYTIASFFDQVLGLGLIGVFDLADQQFRHVRLTGDRALIDSIVGDPAEPLWWTEQRLDTLFSPYFPFTREKVDHGRTTYRRLLDQAVLDTPTPDPGGRTR